MVLSNIDIQDKSKQSREERHKEFIENVHLIESYPSIDDVPNEILSQFRTKYFGKINKNLQNKKSFDRETDPEWPTVTTNDFRIYGVYIDMVNHGYSLDNALRKNKICSKTFYQKVKKRNVIIYTDLDTGKSVTGSTYQEVFKNGKKYGVDVRKSIFKRRSKHFVKKNGKHEAKLEIHHYVQKVAFYPIF